jgi:hypothetical protein
MSFPQGEGMVLDPEMGCDTPGSQWQHRRQTTSIQVVLSFVVSSKNLDVEETLDNLKWKGHARNKILITRKLSSCKK